MPSPQSPPPATPNTLNNNKNPYMDLISEPKSSSGMFLYPPPHGYVIPGMHVAPSTKYYFLHLHKSSQMLWLYLHLFHHCRPSYDAQSHYTLLVFSFPTG